MNIKHFILIDYENVQPKKLIIQKNIKYFVFIGKLQKTPYKEYIKKLGKNLILEKLDITEKDYLDKYLIYNLGKIEKEASNSYSYIISKDKGYDSLIKSLNLKKIKVARIDSLETIKNLKNKEIKDLDSLETIKNLKNKELKDLIFIKNNLKKIKNPLPKNKKKLCNYINHIYPKPLNETYLTVLILKMIKNKIISIKNDKILYSLK